MKYPKFKNRVFKFSVLNKLILSYVVLIIILASVIGITSFSLSVQNYNSQISLHNQKLLENYATYINNTITDKIREVHKNICLNLNIKTDIGILFRQNCDMGKVKTLFLELNSIVTSSHNMIESIHIYTKENEFFISSTLGLKYNNELNKIYWPNLQWVDEIDKQGLIKNFVWLPPREVKYTSVLSTNVLSYISTYPANMPFSSAKGYIAIDIREEYLQGILNETSLDDVGHLFLMDNMGNIITSSSETSLIANDIQNTFLNYDSILSGKENTVIMNGTKNIFNYSTVNNEWIIVRIVPVDEFYSVSRDMAANILLISLAAVITSIIIARIFAGKLYYPLQRIVLRIKSLLSQTNTESKKKNDEYVLIDNALTEFNTKVLHLEQNWEDSIPKLKQNLLHSIINNTLDLRQTFNKSLLEIGIKIISGKFNIILIHLLDHDVDYNRYEDKNMMISIDKLIVHLENLADNDAVFVASKISAQKIAALIISQNEQIEDYLLSIISYASETLMININISIGSWQSSPQDCYISYQEALEAYQYHYFMPEKTIFNIGDMNFENEHVPEEKNGFDIIYAQYHKSLINEDTESANHTINKFVEKIINAEMPLNYKKEHLLEMTKILIDYSKETHIDSDDPIFQKNYPSEDLDNIYEYESWLIQATTHFIELKKRKGTLMIDDIIKNIKHYIKDHLSEDLSLTKLSDYTTLSNSYLSHLFKEATGIGLIDYITQKRMQRARELLENTNLSIGVIGEASGYYTAHYFSKKFKQYYGISPRKYRIEGNHDRDPI